VQRARILDATARLIAEQGYRATSVATIVAAAGVSRRAFYEHFADKDDAALEAFAIAARFVVPRVTEAFRGERDWARGLGAALASYLAILDCDRSWTVFAQVEVAAAGARAAQLRRAAMEPFVAEVDAARPPSARRGVAAVALVAAVDQLVRDHLQAPNGPLLSRWDAIWRRAIGEELLQTAVAEPPMPRAASGKTRRADAIAAAAERGDVRLLRALVVESAAAGDGPALWQAVLAHHRSAVPRLPDEVLAEALGALERAWFFGLPLEQAGQGSGRWSVPSLAARCLEHVAAHPGCSGEDVRRALGLGHASPVNRTLARLESQGLVRRETGRGRANAWYVAASKNDGK
jgi:AcrR family transcriptional regulator